MLTQKLHTHAGISIDSTAGVIADCIQTRMAYLGCTDVERYLSAFEGRGDLTDGSTLQPVPDALAACQTPDDITVDIIAAEPIINQPVELNFDHRGRLWVVQYNQYPYPAGLKVVDTDWHLRANPSEHT